MKVIKKGSASIDMPRQHDCRCCGARLEFTESDGRVFTRSQDRILEVVCPECNTKIEIVTYRAPEVPRYTMDCKTKPLDSDRHTVSHVTKSYANSLGRIES